MFSQYTWWDFIKFVLLLAVPYYAYVLVKYYREDIREWISNRGQSKAEPTAQETDEDEASPSIFTVRDYSKTVERSANPTDMQESDSSTPRPSKPVDAMPAPSTVTELNATHQDDPAQDEVELQGPAVKTGPDVVFGLPVQMLTDNPDERPVDEIINAAGRLRADEKGKLVPIDADDKPAAKIADVINQQQGHPLNDFAFNR